MEKENFFSDDIVRVYFELRVICDPTLAVPLTISLPEFMVAELTVMAALAGVAVKTAVTANVATE